MTMVKAAVTRVFGDESGVQIEDNDIIMWVNDATEEITNRNKILKGTSTLASVIGQASYTFPAVQIHEVEALHYDGGVLPNMTFAQAEESLVGNGSLMTQAGTPELWYEWGGTFSFWPVPNAVKTITLYYTLRPVRITGMGDTLTIPDKYYQNILNYVLQKAYELNEDWVASQAKGQQFDASVADMGEEERNAQNLTYPVITLVGD
jgi:hypothetical protein